MQRAIILFLVFLIISSCKVTNVSYSGLRPADVTLPKEIQNVVLVNRYKADRRNQWLNVVEGLFTGEILFADKRGVEQALAALQTRLQDGPKYNVAIASEQLTGTGTGIIPPPLTSNQIWELCQINNADAVVAIESFDSDINITAEPRQRKRTVNGQEVIENYFEAIEQVRINMTWRTYNGKNGNVIDQHTMVAQRAFTATGLTPDIARRGLIFPVDAIMRTAFEGGDSYGIRISPSWVNYVREIYTKGSRSGQMKAAKRMAIRGDWEGAAKIWERLSQSDNEKIAKRSSYNRAVAAEFMGNYEEALTWARKAADQYGLRRADRYIWTIKARLGELQRLDQQMEDVK
jgi:tetratricopeptide (TPR) repeat protein